MSLINDALKRASGSKPPANDGSMQPVPESNNNTSPWPVILCIVGIGALLGAGGFWLKSKGTPPPEVVSPQQSSAQLTAASPRKADESAPAQTIAAPKKEQMTLPAASPPIPVQSSLGVTNRAAVEDKVERAQPETTAAPAEPAFRLQAIYYRFRNPSAVVNGKTVQVGDTVDGATILAIERTSVELEQNGKRSRISLQ